MASHKKHSEGIALLSMYGDDEEDDEMDEIEEEVPQPLQEQNQQQLEQNQLPETLTPAQDDAVSADDYHHNPENSNTNNENDDIDSKLGLAVKQSQQEVESYGFAPNASNLVFSGLESNLRRNRTRPTIVDYGHDEMAMSPEPEEGEVSAKGQVIYREQLQTANGEFREQTRTTQATLPQSSDQNDHVNESAMPDIEEDVKVTLEETKDLNNLNKFLPPPPNEKCSPELQDKIRKFLTFRRSGKSFNAEVRNRKEYRNPDFLLHAVTHLDIDQIGSCFSKDVFDPHGYDKSDFYDDIEMDMRREMERKEQERKRSPKVEFVSGGTVPTPKINIPTDGTIRPNKKSKWDKVDGDQKNDNLSAVAANAALLSAANAGAGYTAFAQQRRREAEDKRTSSDRRIERRS